jgi:hypothetical protein
MILYHGTNQRIGKIDLSKGRLRTDFGLGFYLSGKLGTAQEWAISKTLLLGGTPTVLQYELSDNYKDLQGHRFPEAPSDEWLDFVAFNRRLNLPGNEKKEPRHEHHWVSGPIADDSMNTVVKEYIAGNISKDEAIHRARILPRTFQISLHTAEAIAFVNDYNVSYRHLKNGRWTKNWIKR